MVSTQRELKIWKELLKSEFENKVYAQLLVHFVAGIWTYSTFVMLAGWILVYC